MLLVIGFFLVSSALNSLCEEDSQPSRYLEFVDDDGVSHIMDTMPTSVGQSSDFRQDSVKFLLFTRQNTMLPQALSIGDQGALKASFFNPNVSTAVIVHGWRGSGEKGPAPIIKEAYFNLASDVNIISVDWSEYADNPDYSASVSAVPDVGRTLARFLEFLNRETGASFNYMHLIGFSLGAHVVGNAGRSLQVKVARVTGLDPAGPLWSGNPNRLRDTDAFYVEAIHTNGGPTGFGTLEEWGATNFYPNGGIIQPGCLLSSCSHSRSYELFAYSVKYNNLIARKCSGMTSMILDNCKGEEAPMGNSDLTKSGYGIYRVDTGSMPPYSL